ncbi:CinA family protein [Rhodococcus xishaensis]|uniref:CinA family protein n=1 Tax=Rhodococcus xishaensis TaxID=2487364 RepID=A0A438AZ08_9NOCA|nr:CinA family protein [Rhodococcus xishaensis]RVW03912.1 CinA family protein [Rhodococcus xishaensis]
MTDPLTATVPARDLIEVLIRRGETIATAESVTAGLLAATLAGVPGASNVLRGGLVVYATDLKSTLAGVDAEVLSEDGPVAPRTAAQLAEGAAHRCAADWGVGLTGVAGPDPQDEHPPGTVFLGLAGPGGTEVSELDMGGDRWEVRLACVHAAVSGLLERLAR